MGSKKIGRVRVESWLLLLVLVIGIAQFPFQLRDFALPLVPSARLSFEPQHQEELALADMPIAMLREINRIVPPHARILLVTDGSDVRHFEYSLYHRALYLLTPREIFWMSPAPSDGTWEARWWRSEPANDETIARVAKQFDVDYVLMVGQIAVPKDGVRVHTWQNATMLQWNTRTELQTDARVVDYADANAIWRSVLGLAGIFVCGALGVEFVKRFGTTFSRGEKIVLAWTLGVGAISFGLLTLSALGLSLSSQVWIILLLCFGGTIYFLYRRNWRLSRVRWKWVTARVGILIFLIAIQTFFVAFVAMARPLAYWDSWVTWSMKARAIFLAQAITPTVYADVSRAVTHLDYPLLLPLNEAWLFQMIGAADDRVAGLLAVGFFLAMVGLVYHGARFYGAQTERALLAAAAVAFIPTLSLLAAQVYADIPLAVYALLTTLYLARWIERGERGALFVAIVGAACLSWTKREGIVLCVCVFVAFLVASPRTRRAWFGGLMCLLASGIVAGGWALFLNAQEVVNTDALPLTLETARANVGRLPTILNYFAKTLLEVQWSFVWVFAALLALLKIFLQPRAPANPFFVAPFLYLAVMACAYLFSAYAPYTAHLASSGYRLVAQVTPLLVVWLALQGISETRTLKLPPVLFP